MLDTTDQFKNYATVKTVYLLTQKCGETCSFGNKNSLVFTGLVSVIIYNFLE